MKRWLAALLSLFIAPAWADVAYVADGDGAIAAFDSTVTDSIAVSGTNKLLIAAVCWGANADGETVSTVVFNGSESLTRLGGILHGSNLSAVDIWYLTAPTSTTANVVVTMNTAVGNNLSVGLVVFQGVNQSTPLDSITTDQQIFNPGTQPTLNGISSATGEMVVDALCAENGTLTAGANQTEQLEVGGLPHLAVSTEAGAATVNMTYSGISNFNGYTYAAVNINAAGAGGGVKVNPISGRGGAAAQPVK